MNETKNPKNLRETKVTKERPKRDLSQTNEDLETLDKFELDERTKSVTP